MARRIALLFVHGMGRDKNKGYEKKTVEAIRMQLTDIQNVNLFYNAVNWAEAFQKDQDELEDLARESGLRNFFLARPFLVSFLGDTIYYQIVSDDRTGYDKVHVIFAKAMRELAKEAGEETALIVIAHSLGTVIASNYFYDLQYEFERIRAPKLAEFDELDTCKKLPVPDGKTIIDKTVRDEIKDTPLEQGKTLVSFFTLGSPLATYNIRYQKPRFGLPIDVPSPSAEKTFDPTLDGQRKYWLNYFDKDDIIAFPLAGLKNGCYENIIKDIPIGTGLFGGMTPAAHIFYWRDNDVITGIVDMIRHLME